MTTKKCKIRDFHQSVIYVSTFKLIFNDSVVLDNVDAVNVLELDTRLLHNVSKVFVVVVLNEESPSTNPSTDNVVPGAGLLSGPLTDGEQG